MKLKLECTARQYAVEIPDSDFISLSRVEDNALIPYGDFLYHKIDKIPGVDNTEYNGHFGSVVYFRILSEDDNEATQSAILATIRDHISMCKRKRAKKAA